MGETPTDSDGTDREVIEDPRSTASTPHASSTWKVLGEIDDVDGIGVLGHNAVTGGTATGVEGVTDSPTGSAVGVRGRATAGSGTATGVVGTTRARGTLFDSAAGVRGESLGEAGSDVDGVLGTTRATGYHEAFFDVPQYAAGVHGRATATTGVVYTAGVYGENASTSGTGHGVVGETTSIGSGDSGVLGRATTGTGGTYGVYGETASRDGGAVGVAGHASTGTAAGIRGSTSGWGYGVYSAGDAKVTGHLTVTDLGDDQETVTVDADTFRVAEFGNRIFEVEGPGLGGAPGNVVAGDPGNHVAPEAHGVVIAGGGDHSPSNGDPRNTPNQVYDNFGTIGGGEHNRVGVDDEFEAPQSHATIGGGFVNTAGGEYATIPGGRMNRAMGDTSFAAGKGAGAMSFGTFVWNDGSPYHDLDGDGTDDGFSSDRTVFSSSEPTGSGTFHVSAENGVRFVTGTSGATTYIASESAGWNQTSSRALKSAVDPVDPGAVLDGVREMPVSTWTYGSGDDDRPRRVGPMAGDFHDALPFEVGDSDDHINTLDADGVALAAIQGLADRLDDAEAKNRRLRRENARLRDRVADLGERTRQIEAHLGVDGETGSTAAGG